MVEYLQTDIDLEQHAAIGARELGWFLMDAALIGP